MHRESDQARKDYQHERHDQGARSRPTPGMSPVEVARRAELSRHLPSSEFPADRDGLLAHLRRRNAPASVIEAISKLPAGAKFRTIGEVIRAMSTHT